MTQAPHRMTQGRQGEEEPDAEGPGERPGSSCRWEPQKELYPELLQPETVVPHRFVRALLRVIRKMPSGSRSLDPPPKRPLAF